MLKKISIATLKRIVKKLGLRWKRARESLKYKRDQEAFDKAKEEINALKVQEKKGELDLFYFDESGFSLDSQVPYAYQPIGKTIEIPSSRSKRINVLGFLSADNKFAPYCFECTNTS